MPKMKTKSSAKKRFKITAKGKVKAGSSHMRHMQMNKPKSMKRRARGGMLLSVEDARIVLRNWMPYARKKRKTSPQKTEGGK